MAKAGPKIIPAVDTADLSSARDRARLSPVAVKATARIADFWGLTTPEVCALLGGISERTWYRLKGGKAEALGPDMLTRVSLVTGIFKGLRLLFSAPLADEWVKRPNRHPLFGGRAPLAAMAEGGIPKMLEVRGYIDALRGGL
jgi:hypothetical protein